MEMYIDVKKACGPRPEKANRRRRVQMRPQTTVHGQKPEFARVLLGALTGRRTGATAGDGASAIESRAYGTCTVHRKGGRRRSGVHELNLESMWIKLHGPDRWLMAAFRICNRIQSLCSDKRWRWMNESENRKLKAGDKA